MQVVWPTERPQRSFLSAFELVVAVFDPTQSSSFGLSREELIDLFQTGEMTVEGRMPYSSNLTMLVTMSDNDRQHKAIYKPGRGERPLHDFPEGLYKREAAMYRLATALGWNVIPPTTVAEGDLGEGSLQAFVNADFQHHYFTLREDGIGDADLRQIAALDIVANNTDRKSGHCLLGADGRVYGIDNGLSFHAQFKLRTVLWDFVGEPLSDAMIVDLTRFVDEGPKAELACLLDRFEVDAMVARAKALISRKSFPADDTDGMRWPWPLV